MRLLPSEEDLELMSTQLHSAITALLFLMFMIIYLHNIQVEFLYVCYEFGAPCDCHRLWPVRRSILRFLCGHTSQLQTFVYVPVNTKDCASYGLPPSMIKQCRFENVPFSMPGHTTWIWLAQRAWTAKNEACLLPKQLGEQVAKLQVRALWECEFMALVMAQVKALDFKLWISRGIMVLSREAAIC